MFVEGQEILEGRYKVMKKCGNGAFGEIYKGKYSALTCRLTMDSGEEKDRRVLRSEGRKFPSNLSLRTFKLTVALQEKGVKHQKHVMLYWESKLIHKLRGKSKFHPQT